MSLYHAHANYISRSGGKSSVGHSAYITGEKAYENRTGITHSYLGKTKEVLYTNILLPEGAEHLNSSEKLWNYVEEFEDELASQRYGNYADPEKQERSLAAKDKYLNSAATAFCLEVSLPKEFNAEEKIELSDRMAKEIFADKKLIVQYAIHDIENNPHVHYISNFRPVIDGDFSLQKYRFRKADIKEIRGQIADITNNYAKERGYDFTIDHRSYAEQGIKLEPTKHRGWWASKLDDKSRIVLENQEILSKNTRYLLEHPEELVKLLIKDKTVFTLDELKKSADEHFKGDLQAWHVLCEYVSTKDIDPLFEKIETFGRFLEVASEIRDLVSKDADYPDILVPFIGNNRLIKQLKSERQRLASNIIDNVSEYQWLMGGVGIAEDTIFFMSDKTPLLWNDRAEFLGGGVPASLCTGDKLDSLSRICGKQQLNRELVDIFNLEYVKSPFKDKEYYIGSKDLRLEKEIVESKSNLLEKSFAQDSKLNKFLGNTPEKNIISVIGDLEKQQGYAFSSEQRDAIISLVEPCCYSALVGKAGTGKTSVLKAVSASYSQAGYRVIGTSFQGAAVGELGSSLDKFMDAGYTLSKLNKEWRLIDQNKSSAEKNI